MRLERSTRLGHMPRVPNPQEGEGAEPGWWACIERKGGEQEDAE